MQLHEAREIFAAVIEIECIICGKPAGQLCNTTYEWVHDERIRHAMLDEDHYLHIATVKKIKLPKKQPTLGDSYAAFADSANDLNTLFTAFNRNVSRGPGEHYDEPVVTLRGLYLFLTTAIDALDFNANQLAEYYQKEKLTETEAAQFAELTAAVSTVNRNFRAFSSALKNAVENDPEDKRDIEDMRHSITELKRHYLHFVLDYSVYMNNLLGENLSGILGPSFNDDEPVDG